MKTKNLPPYAPTLIESTRAIGYSLESAVADILDNSIAAEANKIDIYFFPIDDAYISILDNGFGMDADELDQAMRYGSKNPGDERNTHDLGRFGLGLKTASLSQCRCLTVVSKKDNQINGRRWDIDQVIKEGDWSLGILDEEEINQIPHIEELKKLEQGTFVVWQELDRIKAGEINFEKSLSKKILGVREHLSLVYHRYLAGESGIKKIKITINGEKVFPMDPFLSNRSERPMDDEVFVINNQKIIIRPFILPHLSKMTLEEKKSLGGKEGLRKQQGFYIYRNKRLIVWGTWFRMIRKGDLSKLARIQVDIPNTLDDLWTLDIKKSTAVPPEEIKQSLEMIIEKIAERSKRTWTFRGKREVSDKAVHFWNRMKSTPDSYYYEVNKDNPMVKQIAEQSPEIKKALYSLLQQIERGLPLNQMYVDMNNDVSIVNDRDQNADDILSALHAMLNIASDNSEKLRMLDIYSKIEPFNAYSELLEKLKREMNHEQ